MGKSGRKKKSWDFFFWSWETDFNQIIISITDIEYTHTFDRLNANKCIYYENMPSGYSQSMFTRFPPNIDVDVLSLNELERTQI